MSLQETKMAAMKLAFFFFTLSAHLEAYHARPVHDSCIYQSFDRQTPVKTAEVIQMVTGEEEPQSPPLPPISSSQEQATYGRDNPNAPPSDREVVPSQGNAVYGGENLEGRRTPPRGPRPGGETIYGRDNPRAPPLPPMASSQEQTTYRRDNPNAPPSDREVVPSQGNTVYDGGNLEGRRTPPRGPRPGGETIHSRDNPNAPPSDRKVAPSQGITVYGGDNLEGRPSPRKPVPGGETIYGRDNPKAPPPPKVAPSRGQTTYGGDNPISGGARVAKKRLADILALLLPLYDETVYGREYLNAQPSPKGPGSGGESAPPSLDKLKAVTSPQVAPSRGQTTYLTDISAPPSLKPDSSMDGTTYGRDDPRTPPSPDPNDGGRQGE